MTTIVAVHGVGNHRRDLAPLAAAHRLAQDWVTALAEGAFGPLPDGTTVTGAYYAHRLRRPGSQSPVDDDTLDSLSPFGSTLVGQWLDHVESPASAPQGRLTRNLRQDLARYAGRRHLPPLLLERGVAVLFGEVARYLDPETPARVLARTEVANAIAAANRDERTIVIAHSLGTVVTYETLHAYPHLRVDHLVTLGSPLALPHAVFHRLTPEPRPRGARPAGVRRWINIADTGDLVAIPPRGVRDHFTGVDHDVETTIHHTDFHTAHNYLRTAAVAQALRHASNT